MTGSNLGLAQTCSVSRKRHKYCDPHTGVTRSCRGSSVSSPSLAASSARGRSSCSISCRGFLDFSSQPVTRIPDCRHVNSNVDFPSCVLASGDAQSSANSRCTFIERSSNHVCSTGLSGSTERHKHAAASNDAVLSPDAPT